MTKDAVFTEEVRDTVLAQLEADLKDFQPCKLQAELFVDGISPEGHEKGDHLVVIMSRQINGREYAHAIMARDPSIDYAPLFRGWHADLMERLSRDVNRPEAA